jgi:signal transduction histidine kinase
VVVDARVPRELRPDVRGDVAVGALAVAPHSASSTEVRIAITVTDAPDAVAICVADDGPGVPPELRDRVFEPFFTTRARGSGLGLAIVRRTVEAYGGTVVDGTPGDGARFRLTLPRVSPGASVEPA